MEQKRQNKQKGNKKISHINMQHILQRLKESKKIKIKRENMQHILQPQKTIKKFTSMNIREKSNKEKNMSNIPCYKKKILHK